MKNKFSIKKIKKIFESNNGRRVIALNDINFNVKSDEFISIIGTSGCGKTTLLRIIADLEKANNGELLVNNQPFKTRSLISTLIFQQNSLFPWLNIENNVAFPLEIKGMRKKAQYFKGEGTAGTCWTI